MSEELKTTTPNSAPKKYHRKFFTIKRIILLSVTQKGKKVVKAHEVYQDNILGLALDNLPLATAVKVLDQFAKVLEAYYDPATLEKVNKK